MMKKGFLNGNTSGRRHTQRNEPDKETTPTSQSSNSASTTLSTASTTQNVTSISSYTASTFIGATESVNGHGTAPQTPVEIPIPGRQKRRAQVPYAIYRQALDQAHGDEQQAIKSLQLQVLKHLQQRQSSEQQERNMRSNQNSERHMTCDPKDRLNSHSQPHEKPSTQSQKTKKVSDDTEPQIGRWSSLQEVLGNCRAKLELQTYTPFPTTNIPKGTESDDTNNSNKNNNPFREIGKDLVVAYSFCVMTVKFSVKCFPFPCTHYLTIEKVPEKSSASMPTITTTTNTVSSNTVIQRVKNVNTLQKDIIVCHIEYASGGGVGVEDTQETTQTFSVKPGATYRFRWIAFVSKSTKSNLGTLLDKRNLDTNRNENAKTYPDQVGSKVQVSDQNIYYDLSTLLQYENPWDSERRNLRLTLPSKLPPKEEYLIQSKKTFNHSCRIVIQPIANHGHGTENKVECNVYSCDSVNVRDLEAVKRAHTFSEKLLNILRTNWFMSCKKARLTYQMCNSIGTDSLGSDIQSLSLADIWSKCIPRWSPEKLENVEFYSHHCCAITNNKEAILNISNLEDGRKFLTDFLVKDANGCLRHTFTPPLHFETLLAPPPTPPKPELCSVSYNWVSMSFDNVTDGATFVVKYRKVDEETELMSGKWSEVSIDPSQYEHTVDGLEEDTCYELLVVSENAAGQSLPSEKVVVQTQKAPPPAPATPEIESMDTYHTHPDKRKSSSSAFKIPKCSGVVKWEFSVANPARVDNSLTFTLQYKRIPKDLITSTEEKSEIIANINNRFSSMQKGKCISMSDLKGFHCHIRGLDPNTWYACRILAHNRAGTSDPTPWAPIKTPSAPPPAVVNYDVQFDVSGVRTEYGNSLYSLCKPFVRIQLPNSLVDSTFVEIESKLDENVLDEWSVFEGKASLRALAPLPDRHALPGSLREVSLLSMSSEWSQREMETLANELQEYMADIESGSNECTSLIPGRPLEIINVDDGAWYCAELIKAPFFQDDATFVLCKIPELGVEIQVSLDDIRFPLKQDEAVNVYRGNGETKSQGRIVARISSTNDSLEVDEAAATPWRYKILLRSGEEEIAPPHQVEPCPEEEQNDNQGLSWKDAIQHQKVKALEENHMNHLEDKCRSTRMVTNGHLSHRWTCHGMFPLSSFEPDANGTVRLDLGVYFIRGHKYSTRIRTCNDMGSSPWSSVLTRTTPPGVPVGVPPPKVDSTVSSREISVLTGGVEDACGDSVRRWVFELYLIEGANVKQFDTVKIQGSDPQSVKIKDLLPASKYALVAYAENSVGCSLGSIPTVIETASETPGKPCGVVQLLHCKMPIGELFTRLKSIMGDYDSAKAARKPWSFGKLSRQLEAATSSCQSKAHKGALLLILGSLGDLHGSHIRRFECKLCPRGSDKSQTRAIQPNVMSIPPPCNFNLAFQGLELLSQEREINVLMLLPALAVVDWCGNTSMKIQYRTITDNGPSEWSDEQTLITPELPPDSVKQVQIESVGINTATLQVVLPKDNGSPIKGFQAEIHRLDDSSGAKNDMLRELVGSKTSRAPGTGEVLAERSGNPFETLPKGSTRSQFIPLDLSQYNDNLVSICPKLKSGSLNLLRVQAINNAGPGCFSWPLLIKTLERSTPGLPIPEEISLLSVGSKLPKGEEDLRIHLAEEFEKNNEFIFQAVIQGDYAVIPLSWRIPHKATTENRHVNLFVTRSDTNEEHAYYLNLPLQCALVPVCVSSGDDNVIYTVRVKLYDDDKGLESSLSPAIDAPVYQLFVFRRSSQSWIRRDEDCPSEIPEDGTNNDEKICRERRQAFVEQQRQQAPPAPEKIKIAQSRMWKQKKKKSLTKRAIEHEFFGPSLLILCALALLFLWLQYG